MRMAREKSHAFETLDVIRGVAAIVVAERHLSRFFGDVILPGGYFAVDIFFVLSGFVLAHAYEQRLRGGLGVARFFCIRLIRLYPLYLFAWLVGVIAVYLKADPLQNVPADGYVWLAAFCALFFLPMVAAINPYAHGNVMPLNHPAWTLPLELLANITHALLAPRLSNRLLAVLLGISGIALIATGAEYGTLDVGFSTSNFLGGFARVGFSYFAGVALYRLWQWHPHPNVSLLFVLTMLATLFVVPVAPSWRLYYDVGMIVLFIPYLIYAAASVKLGALSSRLLLPLGAASYAYYVLHVPFAEFCEGIARHVGIVPLEYTPWSGIMLFVVLLGITLMLDAWYDRPSRKTLIARVTKH
jgi:peptidoglycan/LPS O-acetylase OafA/YrhL